MKVLVQIDAGDLVQDIDDGMGAAVKDAAVVFIAIPLVRFGAPYTAVSIEFINTDGLKDIVPLKPPHVHITAKKQAEILKELHPRKRLNDRRSFLRM